MEDSESAKSPAPSWAVKHCLCKISRCEGGDEVGGSDVCKDESSILQLRCVREKHAQDVVAVITTGNASEELAHTLDKALTL